MELPYALDDFCSTATELVRLNKLNAMLRQAHRPARYGEVGVNPLSSPIDIYMACWSWGAYLAPTRIAKGFDVGSALDAYRAQTPRYVQSRRTIT